MPTRKHVFLKYFGPSSLDEGLSLPLLVPIDYYILENNSQLKAALKSKRILLTDFRTVQIEHFGKNQLSLFCVLSDIELEKSLEKDIILKEILLIICLFSMFFTPDLPLKISYPPDFSESRHYGLLLLMYVSYNKYNFKQLFLLLCSILLIGVCGGLFQYCFQKNKSGKN